MFLIGYQADFCLKIIVEISLGDLSIWFIGFVSNMGKFKICRIS